jgi:hypothetical protein
MAQHEKKGAKPAEVDLLDFGKMLESVEVSRFKTAKAHRDELDAGVPNILSLNAKERTQLAGAAFGLDLGLTVRLSPFKSPVEGAAVPNPKEQQRDARMSTLKTLLLQDPEPMTSERKKAYQAALVHAWGEARTSINEILESPSVRKLLDPKAKP